MGKYPRTRVNRQRVSPHEETSPIGAIELGSEPTDEPCEHAKKFTEFAALVLDTVANARQLIYINRAKILLTDQYFRIRRTLPAYHQDTTNYNGHPCIYQAYVAAYEQLEKRELEVAPPAFELPVSTRARRKDKPEPSITDPEVIKQMIIGKGHV